MRPFACIICIVLVACDTIPTSPITRPALDATPSPIDADPIDAGSTYPDAMIPAADATVVVEDARVGPVACDPPLSVTPSRTHVLPFDLIAITAAGGTGAYRYELVGDASGAIVNAISGEYVSGSATGVTDVVAVTDLGCEGRATAPVDVVIPLALRPRDVELPQGTSFRFEVSAGSGRFAFAITDNRGGGVVDNTGTYRASTTREGRDVVIVTDVETGEEVRAEVQVVAGASLRLDPPHIHVPVGSSYDAPVVGGSGWLTGVSSSTVVELVDGKVRALGHGRARLDLIDRFTGQSARLIVDAVGGQTFTATRAGDYYGATLVAGPGDLDGDGYADALFGNGEADIGVYNSGAIYVYRGGPAGLEPDPAQILSTGEIESRFGRSFATADFDQDGLIDLAAGAERADATPLLPDSGAVFIFRGVPGGFFEDEPSLVINGLYQYDYFGFALTACDFNADGRIDLAVSGWLHEDRSNPASVVNDQGAVHLFLGRPTGITDQPDQTIYGELPNGDGTWGSLPSLRFATHLASADIDGDGACDLVSGTYSYTAAPGANNDGLVLIYRGVPAAGGSPGGLAARPARGMHGGLDGNRAGQFGRTVSAGDIDGDGRAEVAASFFLHDSDGRGNRGGIRVFRGAPLPDQPTDVLETADDADWAWEGNDANDQSGYYVRVADADGDMLSDLLVGNLYDESTGGVGAAGTVTIFRGQVGLLPDPTVTSTLAGTNSGGRFGVAVDALGDVDGDGRVDVIVSADYEDRFGLNVGVPYFISGDDTQPALPLLHPSDPAGGHGGRGAAVVGDLDGDGYAELAIGAPGLDFRDLGINTGAVFVYRGGANGFERNPMTQLSHFVGHSDSDWTGWAVSAAGDFDGDGISDLAVLSRYEDVPNTFDARYAPDGACAGARFNVGAIYVFRGTRGGVEPEPAFIWYGPQQYQQLQSVAGAFDYDGDGFDDLIVGGHEWDRPGEVNAGGFALLRGRPYTGAGATQVICNADYTFIGTGTSMQLGRGVTPIGDINGDGCDEFAVGAVGEAIGLPFQGTVRVVYGWGGARCPAQPEAVVLGSGIAYFQGGFDVDGGLDVDGDQIPDLVTSSIWAYQPGVNVGAVWLISGAYLNSLARSPLAEGAVATYEPFVDPAASQPRLLMGEQHRGFFGWSVALVPQVSGPGRAGIAVGMRDADFSGNPIGGGARVYRFDAVSGIGPAPVSALGGERPESYVGETISAGLVGNRPTVVVGATFSSAVGVDQGTVLVMDLGP